MSTVNEIILAVSSDHDKELVSELNKLMVASRFKVLTPFFNLAEFLEDRADFMDDYTFIGVVKNFDDEDFRAVLKQLPWKYPEQVQVIVKREGEVDCYEFMETLLVNERVQDAPLLYNPATGIRFGEEGSPQNVVDDAQGLRECKQVGAWLFDPWTGKLRDSFEVLEDPYGRQIDPPVDLSNLKELAEDNGVTVGVHFDSDGVNVGIVVAKTAGDYPGLLNVRDLNPELPYEEAIEFLLSKPNPDFMPISIYPEPIWWKAFTGG